MKISVVLPVHNERRNVAPLLEELIPALGSRSHEVVAVDDGSSDGSLDELRELRHRFPALRVVTLVEHAGQSAAFAAGFDAARGDVIVTMDADGQYDPADLPTMVDKLTADCVAVVGYRARRADSRWKRWQSAVANGIRNWVTGDRVRDIGCSLRVMRREALQQMPRFQGMHRFFPTLLRLQGGRVIEVPVSHRPRRFGRSHYGMLDRVFVAFRDALGVRWLRRRVLRYRALEERRDS